MLFFVIEPNGYPGDFDGEAYVTPPEDRSEAIDAVSAAAAKKSRLPLPDESGSIRRVSSMNAEIEAKVLGLWVTADEYLADETPARVEDALIDAHNAGVLELSTETCGYEIVHTRVTRRIDALNLPAYRHEVTIIARWRDENSTRPLAESFAGYGPTWEVAEAKALAGYNAWRMKLNRIGGAS